MTIPAEVRAAVDGELARRHGPQARVTLATRVGGGCISPTSRLDTTVGAFFLKLGDPDLPPGLLQAEARGLHRLREAGAIRVPEVVARSGAGPEWLLLEWLEPGAATPASWELLGEQLADLHRCRGEVFGDGAPNFIGSLPQDNTPDTQWWAFWRDRRLEPQLRLAEARGLAGSRERRRFEALYERLPELLAPGQADGPSLLHGDLWSGNVHVVAGGTPAVIDPSAYHGHREVDLAMAALFGGFGAGFWQAYRHAWPLAPGHEVRRAVYQLYYLLVHVNLFGGSYLRGARAALDAAGV